MVTAYAQGTVAFANNSDSLFVVSPSLAPVPAPGFAQLFAAPAGTAFTPFNGSDVRQFLTANPGWEFGSPPAPILPQAPGRFNGNTVTIRNIAPGAAADAVIVAWQGNYTSFYAAYNAGALIGVSDKMHFDHTGNPVGPIPGFPVPLTSAQNLNGPVIYIPEPSTVCLISLAGTAMLFWRCDGLRKTG